MCIYIFLLNKFGLLWQFLSYKHHHWVRDNSWVQIIIIKVIYSLAREDLLVTINTHELSQWGKTERDKRKQLSVGFYSPLSFKAFLLSLPTGRDVSSFTSKCVKQGKGKQMPPWPPGYKSVNALTMTLLPSAFPYLLLSKSHKECFSNYE